MSACLVSDNYVYLCKLIHVYGRHACMLTCVHDLLGADYLRAKYGIQQNEVLVKKIVSDILVNLCLSFCLPIGSASVPLVLTRVSFGTKISDCQSCAGVLLDV